MSIDLEVGKSKDDGYNSYGNLTDLLDHEFWALSRFVNLGSPNTRSQALKQWVSSTLR
jgi:hypothetical protein